MFTDATGSIRSLKHGRSQRSREDGSLLCGKTRRTALCLPLARPSTAFRTPAMQRGSTGGCTATQHLCPSHQGSGAQPYSRRQIKVVILVAKESKINRTDKSAPQGQRTDSLLPELRFRTTSQGVKRQHCVGKKTGKRHREGLSTARRRTFTYTRLGLTCSSFP